MARQETCRPWGALWLPSKNGATQMDWNWTWAKRGRLFHITRKRTSGNPGIQLPDGRSVEAIEAKETIRWMLFYRKMTFKAHVKEACCHALTAGQPPGNGFSYLFKGPSAPPPTSFTTPSFGSQLRYFACNCH
jgi:hypothetical protein